MDYFDISFGPIRKSIPTRTIKVHLINDNKKDWRNVTQIMKVNTNTTVKHWTTYNTDSKQMHYGSHHHWCSGCHISPKIISQNHTNFKRYFINESIKNNIVHNM